MNKAILLLNVTALFSHIFTGDAIDLIWSFNKFLNITIGNKVLITQATTLTKNGPTFLIFFTFSSERCSSQVLICPISLRQRLAN